MAGKKAKKHRGSRTHGRGIKGGRGAGERGGRGKAGLGKHKWIKVVKDTPDYFGPKGFTRPKYLVKDQQTINIYEIDENMDRFVQEGVAKKDGDIYSLDLGKAGYDKLLSRGTVRNKMKVTVDSSSKKAINKIEDAGGEVITSGETN